MEAWSKSSIESIGFQGIPGNSPMPTLFSNLDKQFDDILVKL
jgi:hypothetical protein